MRGGLAMEEPRDRASEGIWTGTRTTPIYNTITKEAIITPQKSTSKLTIASAKANESLNECLYRTPVIIPSLIGILVRVKQGHYLVITDAEKAFLQVSLKREDGDATRNRNDEKEFIMPSALWKGGVCERVVGVIKGKAIATKLLNNGELITLVTDFEAIINERSLI
ncbi:Integrase core domain protein [Dirofilaria immitis]|nr:Integrase core domain protein [Dirofilaria immitis]